MDVPDRVDRALTGSGAFEPIAAVRGDTAISLEYVHSTTDFEEMRQQRIELMKLILDRL